METPEASMHVFDAAIALSKHDDNTYTGHTSAAYGNMVGPFGGVIGATLLNAVMCHPDRLGEPLSLTVHYAAPIADGSFSVHARAVRTNRSTQHWFIELIQAGEVAAFATAVTAIRRDTWSATDAAFPHVPPADSITPTPAIPAAAWTACYDMRFIDGGPGTPDTGGHPSQSRLWIRDQPSRPLDFLSLSAICDAFFPRIFVRRPKWVPIGTVTLTTYFHASATQLAAQGNSPLLGVARALHFGKGFFDQSAEVWNADGVLLAATHQVVYFKE
ncbi:thioesterase family protein [Noviherbaspirillum cavernae]|uniref:Thioesterase family protein n=1 Tax=Noviherbaspirillum cavernae TaxID=2320862 RepID=A0A418WVN7_9BURK|nr:thioesterase family protein [Noviherbaspirillum cavernae]RJF96750.1 thioesterase family protein [Noviherbaspirillum cavernae]